MSPASRRGSRPTSTGAEAPFSFELIAGGRSNLTFRVTDARGLDWALRRPPVHHVLPTAHDMVREHTVIAAVGPAGVPVPRAVALCTDESVNERPFYVMEFVEGLILRDAEDGRRRAGPRGAGDGRGRTSPTTLAGLHAARPRRRRPRLPRAPRRLHRAPAAALAGPVRADEGRRHRPGRDRRRGGRGPRRTHPGPAARLGRPWRLPARQHRARPRRERARRSSTGRSARSATRSPTSGCCATTGRTPATPRWPSWGRRPRSAPGFESRDQVAKVYEQVERTRLRRARPTTARSGTGSSPASSRASTRAMPPGRPRVTPARSTRSPPTWSRSRRTRASSWRRCLDRS